jgi:hypothetical protein
MMNHYKQITRPAGLLILTPARVRILQTGCVWLPAGFKGYPLKEETLVTSKDIPKKAFINERRIR